MKTNTLIEELNLLWEPVRPYLVRQIEEVYGRRGGDILEIGPFSGLLFALAQKNIGRSFTIAAFPQAAILLYRGEAREHGMEERVRVIESSSSLAGIVDNSVDLAIFRGAFFFPTLFQVDFGAIYRTLRTAGIAFIGGGYGKYSPPELIGRIKGRSEELNAALGRVRITVENLRNQLRSGRLEEECEITTDGGLWIIMRK